MKETSPSAAESKDYVNLERLTFLIDGVFAITLTLLVLELRPPEAEPSELGKSLLAMLPRLSGYLIAFYTIANHWLVHQRTFRHITHEDTLMLWLTMVGLLFITLMPATTALVGRYPGEKLAVACFSANSFLQALMNWIFWAYVLKGQKRFAGQSDPRMLAITTRVWLFIAAGWLASIALSFVSVPVAYVSWVLFPNLVGIWGNRRRQLIAPAR